MLQDPHDDIPGLLEARAQHLQGSLKWREMARDGDAGRAAGCEIENEHARLAQEGRVDLSRQRGEEVRDLASYVREMRLNSVALQEKVKGHEADQQCLRSGLANSLAEGRFLKSANSRLSGMLKSGSRWNDDACETLETVCYNQSLEIESLKGRLAQAGCESASLLEKRAPPEAAASASALQQPTTVAAASSARDTVSDGLVWRKDKVATNMDMEKAQELKQLLGASRIISKHRYNQSSSTTPGTHASALATTSWSKVEGALQEARAAAEDMMDAAITACDVQAQQLQRSLTLQAEKWEWAAVVQQHSVVELKRKEHECQQLRQDLDTANRRHQRQLDLMARDRRCLADMLTELNKHLELIPRFRPLLNRLGVSEKIAAMERQSIKTSQGMHVCMAQAGLSPGKGSAPTASRKGSAPTATSGDKLCSPKHTPGRTFSETKVEIEPDSIKGAVPVRRMAWMPGEYRWSPAALPRPKNRPQQQNGDSEDRTSLAAGGERDPCVKTDQDELLDSRTFLNSLSISEYDDKVLQLDHAVLAHRQELQAAHAHVESVNTQLEEEKRAFDRLVEAYEEIRIDNSKLASQLAKVQRQQHIPISQNPQVAHSAKQGTSFRSGTRMVAQESKEIPSFVLRKILAALANTRQSMLFSMLSEQERRSLLAGKDKYLSPNAKVIKRRKNDMICRQGDVVCTVLLVISGELEMWVSHVRGEGQDGDGEVSKMLTRRLQTIEAGHTIGDVDMILRRPHLASVIVSSAQCELVEISTSALRELVDKNKMLVKQITRQALLEEGALFSSLPFPGSHQRSEHASLLTDAQAAGEVAALCTSAVF